MPRRRIVPAYVPAVDFFKSLGLHFEQGSKLVVLGVLKADATLNERPIFKADAMTREKAKLALSEYRKRQNRRIQELKEVYA